MEKNIDYNKEFPIGFQNFTISRSDYESMPDPMKTDGFDDEKMKELAKTIGVELKKWNFDKESEYYEDEVEGAFWREMEECAVAMGMTYYEDEVDEEIKPMEIKPMIVSRLATIMETSDAEAIADVISLDVAQDVSETADQQNWNSADVDIAIVRVLKKKLGIEE
jgi:hypothetical protein